MLFFFLKDAPVDVPVGKYNISVTTIIIDQSPCEFAVLLKKADYDH